MAELEPTVVKAPKDERDEVARLQRQLERAQFDANQKEAFGKYDAVVPNEGELNYQEYLSQRPAEGVIRDEDSFRDAQSGKFATAEAYEAQQTNSQDHYDQLGGLVNKGEYQPPEYEAMGVLQLAKEAAKARKLGDRAEEGEIYQALQHYLTMDAMKDDTESPDQAQARYDSELARYESLVERFLGRPDENAQPAEQAHVEPNGEGVPSARVAPEEAVADAESKAEPEQIPPEQPEPEQAPKQEEDLGPGTYYDGKKVSVARVLEATENDDERLEVVDTHGNIYTVFPSELVYKAPQVKEPGKELELYNGEREETKEVQPEPGKELELYKVEREKAKKWWQKAGDHIRPVAGLNHWAALWAAKYEANIAAPIRDKWDGLLNRGVDESMSEEEKEKKRNTNRYIVIGAGAALAALSAVAAGMLLAKGISSSAGLESADLAPPTPGPEAVAEQVVGAGATAGAEAAAEVPAFTPEMLNISQGEGGYELFQSLGLDNLAWDNAAPALLANFPDDFYSYGNEVRIAHPGALSQGAQDFINSLRQG